MEFQGELSESDAVNFQNLVLTQNYMTLACKNGFFVGVIQGFEDNKGIVKFTYWIKETA